MKIKKSMLTATAVIVGGAILAPKLVEAYRGDPTVQGPNYSEERHATMTQAFADQDYQVWQEQMQGRGKVSEVVTEENFSQFAEAHRLASEGKTEEARQIRQELGLGLGEGHSKGRGDQAGQAGAEKGRAQKMGNCPNL